MSDKYLPVVPEKAPKLAVKEKQVKPPKDKKVFSLAVKRVLKKNKFSPLSILINQVFPQLPPSEQASILLRLMSYIYPTVRAVNYDGKRDKKAAPTINVHTQVAAASTAPQNEQIQQSLHELMRLAASNNDYNESDTKSPDSSDDKS